MAEPQLRQSDVDELVRALAGPEPSIPDAVTSFDFRRPHKLTRDDLRKVAAVHDQIGLSFGAGLTNMLRRLTSVEALSSDQITYEDYVRSVPNPSVLAVFRILPIDGVLVVEMGADLALALIDRLLGGPGVSVGLRRPTELEQDLLTDVLDRIVEPVRSALTPFAALDLELVTLELNAQFLQVARPADVMLLHTCRVEMAGSIPTEGILTLCWPVGLLQSIFEPDDGPTPAMEEARQIDPRIADALHEVEVPVSVRLREATISAGDLVGLRPGDVIGLQHRATDAVEAHIGGQTVMRGQLGRRGERLALQLNEAGERSVS